MIPRPEYPRPELRRGEWSCLNGEWQFAFDHGKSGAERRMFASSSEDDFPLRINVPFCPESKLSGIGDTDFAEQVWYRRRFDVPDGWLRGGRRVLLNFEAVDYESEVYINGASAGTHFGGYTPFSLDITRFVRPGENTVVVRAADRERSGNQPRGKQSQRYYSLACSYTRTTGIWQTVWLESVPANYIKSYRVIPDPENGVAHVTVLLDKPACGASVEATASFGGEPAARSAVKCAGSAAYLELRLPSPKLWDVGQPNLYELELALHGSGAEDDRVEAYFGMRSVAVTENDILINGRPVFMRLVLDQGFYPDGVCTAPSDGELKRDIELALACGFNGARFHQKVFERRSLYWADRLGYLVWGEFGDSGLELSREGALLASLPEWREAVERDFSHPCVIGWCPFNETKRTQLDRVVRAVYDATKSLDPTRPVIDTSGFVHVATDVYDIHEYEEDIDTFIGLFDGMEGENVYNPHFEREKVPKNAPYFVSEYGGTWWNTVDPRGWGHGRADDIEEVYDGIEWRTAALAANPRVCGFCFTQLTDVELEQNGIYNYDRTEKFDMERIRRAFGAPRQI